MTGIFAHRGQFAYADKLPKILGAVLSRFQIQNGTPIKNTLYWIQKIDSYLLTEFKQILSSMSDAHGRARSMFLPEATYSQVRCVDVDGGDPEVIGRVAMLLKRS